MSTKCRVNGCGKKPHIPTHVKKGLCAHKKRILKVPACYQFCSRHKCRLENCSELAEYQGNLCRKHKCQFLVQCNCSGNRGNINNCRSHNYICTDCQEMTYYLRCSHRNHDFDAKRRFVEAIFDNSEYNQNYQIVSFIRDKIVNYYVSELTYYYESKLTMALM